MMSPTELQEKKSGKGRGHTFVYAESAYYVTIHVLCKNHVATVGDGVTVYVNRSCQGALEANPGR